MPKYKATLEISVDGDDVDWLYNAVDQLREMDGVKVTQVSPYANNPVDYPIFEDDDEDDDYLDDDYEDEDDDYWDEEEDGVYSP